MALTLSSGWQATSDMALATLKNLGSGQSLYEVITNLQAQIDACYAILSAQEGLVYDHENTSGLNFAYKAGVIDDGTGTPVVVAAGTIALTASQTNYIMVNAAGTVSKSTSGWEAGKRPLAIVVAGSAGFAFEDVTDRRGFIVNPADSSIAKVLLDDDIQARLSIGDFTIGAESANAIDVTIQLQDASGNAISEVRLVDIWLADAVNGGVCTTAPDGGWSITTGTLFETITANKYARVLSNTDGEIVIRVTHAAGAKTLYLALLQSGDKVTYSGAITFA